MHLLIATAFCTSVILVNIFLTLLINLDTIKFHFIQSTKISKVDHIKLLNSDGRSSLNSFTNQLQTNPPSLHPSTLYYFQNNPSWVWKVTGLMIGNLLGKKYSLHKMTSLLSCVANLLLLVRWMLTLLSVRKNFVCWIASNNMCTSSI